jgi:hypothetical protein
VSETTEKIPVADLTIGTHTCSTPCGMCPFLTKWDGDTGRGFVNPGRRWEFLNGAIHGRANDFICHKTGEVDDEDEEQGIRPTSKSLACAGARLTVLRGGESTNNMDVEERLNMFDPEAFLARNVKVGVWTLKDVKREAYDAEEDIETCCVVAGDCEAPAGFISGDGITNGTVAAENFCKQCGEHACDACFNHDAEKCQNCEDDEEGDDW